MAHLRGLLGVSTRRRQSWRDFSLRDDGLVGSMRKGHIVQPRVLLSYYEYQAYQRPDVGSKRSCGVRKKMVPLIKLVHPDLFAQYPPKVASTNSKSLKDLNTLIDAAEVLEGTANGGELLTPPSVDPFYNLYFFHHKPDRNGEQESMNTVSVLRPLSELRAELRFAPALSANPAASLRGQLNRQLEGLLLRATEMVEGGLRGINDGGGEKGMTEEVRRKAEEDRLVAEGVRVHEGETEEDFYGVEFGGMSRRSSSRYDAHEAGDGGKTMTSEELRKMTIEHAADNLHGKRWFDAGIQFGSGFFGGGLMPAAREGAEAALQARSRQVDDLLRSGRVQFAGVPVSREALALRRLHQALVKNFEHLELDDQGLWSTVMLVLRARSMKYEVQVHSGGPILILPEDFTEKNLVLFLGETMLSYG